LEKWDFSPTPREREVPWNSLDELMMLMDVEHPGLNQPGVAMVEIWFPWSTSELVELDILDIDVEGFAVAC
jgi:hypothetical protein